MRKDKLIALRLRHAGKSYGEISKNLNVAKSTLSEWFKGDKRSEEVKKTLRNPLNDSVARRIKAFVHANRIKWENWREAARQNAREEFENLSKDPLFIAGLMLYWAEGDSKPKNPVRLTNTSPEMIKLYTKFLTKVIKIPIETIRATAIIYPDLSHKTCLDFWSNVIGIPESQFYKTQVIKGKHPTKRLSNGICIVICGNRQLKEKFLVWIDLLAKKL